ncbi:hypothetical protein [Streptomyces subrutilus]
MQENDDMAAYEKRRAAADELAAWYEASDHAEYLDELDARDAERD